MLVIICRMICLIALRSGEYIYLKISYKDLVNWIFVYKLGYLWATLWLIVILLPPHTGFCQIFLIFPLISTG